MTRAVFEEVDGTLTLLVSGHAESAPIGQDLVCAGCTALVYALGQYVADAEDWMLDPPLIELASGVCAISCRPAEQHREKARAAFDTALAGFRVLENNYPQYVVVITRGTPRET